MFKTLSRCPRTVARHENGPLQESRRRDLEHLAAQGAALHTLQRPSWLEPQDTRTGILIIINAAGAKCECQGGGQIKLSKRSAFSGTDLVKLRRLAMILSTHRCR